MQSDQRSILITGASSGIGAETARKLAGRGVRLSLSARRKSALDAVADECMAAGAAAAHVFPCDLTAPRAAEEMVRAAFEAMNGLDAVVHCAGVGLIQSLSETTDGDFSRVNNINSRGTFLVVKAACEVFSKNKRGRFVTLPGILGKTTMKNASAYIASKFAVTGMIRAIAQEVHRQGIQFSLLHLGGVDTPFWNDAGMSPQRDKMIDAGTAADCVLLALDAPDHLVVNEMVIQPEVHQMGL